jgi:ribosome-binding protein aMBF1 (putative translation factor)
MLVHTKRRRIKVARKKSKTVLREKSIPWREVARENIEKYTEVGLAIRGARFRAELTQKELAEQIDVLPHHISEMEHGKRPVSKKMAHKLAEKLNVNYKVFL